MSTRAQIIHETLANADELQRLSMERAREDLFEVFAPKLKQSISDVISESVSVGKDQPSGYDPEEDQDALAFGSSKHSTAKKDDINKGGKGPQKLEGSINMDEDGNEDGLDVVNLKETEEELDETSYEDEELDEDSEEELDETSEEELDETSEELDEKKKCKEDDMDENADKDADDKLKFENARLAKENKEYKKAFTVLNEKSREVNLLNAKLSGAMKFLRDPNLTMKQKQAIVETFDRAKSVREVKLISSTLNESLKNVTVKKQIIQKPVRSAASRTINENYNYDVQRMRTLSGLND